MGSSSSVPIPCDEEAEWMIVALAIAHPDNATAAVGQLAPDDFYHPGLAAALEVAVQLDGVMDLTRRISAVALATGIREAAITAHVADRVGPVARWSDKVRSSARRRRAMALAARIYNGAAAASVAELADVAQELCAELETAATEASEVAVPSQPTGERHALGYYRSQRDADS